MTSQMPRCRRGKVVCTRLVVLVRQQQSAVIGKREAPRSRPVGWRDELALIYHLKEPDLVPALRGNECAVGADGDGVGAGTQAVQLALERGPIHHGLQQAAVGVHARLLPVCLDRQQLCEIGLAVVQRIERLGRESTPEH